MHEPSNSWEICFVLARYCNLTYPVFMEKTGLPENSLSLLNRNLEYPRRKELLQWAEEHYSPKWFRDHI